MDGLLTRASGTAWDDGDAIGISTLRTTATVGGTSYANMKYTTPGNGIFTHAADLGGESTGIFFQDAEEVTFRAYYPHTGNEGTDPGAIVVNTTDQTNQSAFDFLFATGATASKLSPTVAFADHTASGGADHSFHHKMAQLNVVFQASTSDGFAAGDIFGATFNLGGLVHEGTFNATDGTTTLTGTPTDSWDITACPHTDASTTRTYSLILLPQDLTGNPLHVAVGISGQTYHNQTTVHPHLEPGNKYTYTITVKKTGLEFGECTITAWSGSTSGNGDVEM